MNKTAMALLTPSLALAILLSVDAAPTKNGFDLAGALVPAEEIVRGGPPRDGIPAIDRPQFVSAGTATYLDPDDRVLGVARNGTTKAYPLAIMNWHEIVNDRFGAEAVAVTYCPLCGTGMAFLSTVEGQTLDFGVSGLLYNSDVLLYDRQSESLWSQIAARAITGEFKGTKLSAIPMSHTTWADWRQRHPATLVLSRETGYEREYDRSPYAGYEQSRELYFPMKFRAQGYHPKERVLGVTMGGHHKAYPFAELARTDGPIRDRIGDQGIEIRFDAEHQTASVLDAHGEEIASVIAFWFAWYGFHPDTEVFRGP